MGSDGRVPHTTKVVYSLGQSGESVVLVGLGLLLIYYNQALHMPASLASAALSIALVFDAFVDPSVDSWSDGIESKRWGRRHLSMFLAVGPLAFCFFMLLWPPAGLGETGLFLWLTFFAIATRTALSFFHVPFLSLGAELTQDYRERTSIVAVRSFVGLASSFLVVGFTWGYFFKATPGDPAPQLVRSSYFSLALLGAGTMAVLLAACTFGTMKTIPHLAGSTQKGRQFSIKRVFLDLMEALKNPSYRALFVGTLIFAIYTGIQRAMSVHLQTFFWQLSPAGIKYIQWATLIGAMSGVFFTGLFTRVFDKKWTVIIGCIGASVFGTLPVLLRAVGMFPIHGQALIWTLSGLDFFVGFIGMQAAVTVGSMMGDIADEHELRHGTRQEGIYFGSYSFSGKLTSGLSVVIAGMAIDLIGLKPGTDPAAVPHQVLTNFGITYAAVALIQIVSTWVFLPYSLDRKRHGEVIAELGRRKEIVARGNADTVVPMAAMPRASGAD